MINWALAGWWTTTLILVGLGIWAYLAVAVWVGRRLHELDVREQERQARRRHYIEVLNRYREVTMSKADLITAVAADLKDAKYRDTIRSN